MASRCVSRYTESADERSKINNLERLDRSPLRDKIAQKCLVGTVLFQAGPEWLFILNVVSRARGWFFIQAWVYLGPWLSEWGGGSPQRHQLYFFLVLFCSSLVVRPQYLTTHSNQCRIKYICGLPTVFVRSPGADNSRTLFWYHRALAPIAFHAAAPNPGDTFVCPPGPPPQRVFSACDPECVSLVISFA